MENVHYLKEILSNQIIVAGRAVPFDNIGANRGVVSLSPDNPEHKAFIDKLDQFAQKGVGGVTRISAQEYAQKKSNPALRPSVRPKEMLRLRPTVPRLIPPPAPPEATVPAAVPPAAGSPAPAAPTAEPDFDPASLKSASEVASQGTPETPAPTAPAESFKPPTRRIGRPGKGKAKTEGVAPITPAQ